MSTARAVLHFTACPGRDDNEIGPSVRLEVWRRLAVVVFPYLETGEPIVTVVVTWRRHRQTYNGWRDNASLSTRYLHRSVCSKMYKHASPRLRRRFAVTDGTRISDGDKTSIYIWHLNYVLARTFRRRCHRAFNTVNVSLPIESELDCRVWFRSLEVWPRKNIPFRSPCRSFLRTEHITSLWIYRYNNISITFIQFWELLNSLGAGINERAIGVLLRGARGRPPDYRIFVILKTVIVY